MITIAKIIIILFFYKLLVVLFIIIIIILYDNNIKKEIRISAKEWHTVSHRSQWVKCRQYEIKWDSKQGGEGGGGWGKEGEKARRKKGKENGKAKKKVGRKGKEKNNTMLLGNEPRSERMSGISHKPTNLTLPISNISLQKPSFIISL